MLQEKPSASTPGEAKLFEVPEAALLLEAARVTNAQDRRGAYDGFGANGRKKPLRLHRVRV